MRFIRGVLLTCAVGLLSLLGAAIGEAACTTTLNPGANLSTAISSAAAGDTICLNAGSWGSQTFTSITRTTDVTVTPTPGQTISMGPVTFDNSRHIILTGSGGTLNLNGVNIQGCSQYITVAYGNFASGTTGIHIDGSSCPSTDTHIVLDHLEMYQVRPSFDTAQICLNQVRGVTITNTHIDGTYPGDSGDPIKLRGPSGVRDIVIGPGNIIENILQANCNNHCDIIQFYTNPCGNVTITGNWFRNNSTFMLNESACNVTFTNNIVQTLVDFQAHCWSGGLVEHNTFYNAGFRPNGMNSGAVIVRNNIWHGQGEQGAYDPNTQAGSSGSCPTTTCTACTASYNVYQSCSSVYGPNCIAGTPTYLDSTPPPDVWANWQLTAASVGYRNASDGLDRGVVFDSSGTPPTGTITLSVRGIFWWILFPMTLFGAALMGLGAAGTWLARRVFDGRSDRLGGVGDVGSSEVRPPVSPIAAGVIQTAGNDDTGGSVVDTPNDLANVPATRTSEVRREVVR